MIIKFPKKPELKISIAQTNGIETPGYLQKPDPNKGNAEYLKALQKALGDSKSDSKKLWELMRDKK